MKQIFIHSFNTSWGRMHSAATERGLSILSLPGRPEKEFRAEVARLFPNGEERTGGPVNRATEKQIKEYLSGRRRLFDLPLDMQGTPFQRKVLRAVSRIPYGRTKTYSEIARAAGNPAAYRAVGMANATNRLPLVIPCHRVVAGNGLGGYGGGAAMKRRLLEMEGAL